MPYFYIVYMFILLNDRIGRDNERCQKKYGKYWDEYKRMVPYKLIPFIYWNKHFILVPSPTASKLKF